jgi:hypothetical protein
MDTSDRITAPISEFCKLAGIGRSLVYEMIGDGRLDSILIGKRRLVVIESYRRLVERQRAASVQTTAHNQTRGGEIVSAPRRNDMGPPRGGSETAGDGVDKDNRKTVNGSAA